MHVTTYNRPAITGIGADGLPNYLSADKADPDRWKPPQGFRLRVWCNGREMHFVVEADRERGWVRTLPYVERNGVPFQVDKPGVSRLHHGTVEYRLARIPIGTPAFRKWLRQQSRKGST